MNRKLFKLSLVSSAILATTQVSAALYNVVEITPNTSFSYKSSYGVAIEPAATTGASDNCFESGAAISGSCSSFKLAGETRVNVMNSGEAVDGLSYREEAPFGMDNQFAYIQSFSDFENYCEAQLGFSTCSAWASPRWNIWSNENSNSEPNSIAFIGASTTGISLDEGNNLVINSISPAGDAVGISSGLKNVSGFRRGSVSSWIENSAIGPTGVLQSRAWARDDTYTVGSVADSEANDNGTFYTSKAAIWLNSSSTPVQIAWEAGVNSRVSNRLAQGSMRDFVISGTTIYGVGFNTYDSSNNYMNATVFVSDTTDISTWSSKVVSNARAVVNSEKIHSNSVLTSINKNLVAIGNAKRDGSAPYKGAAPNRLFIVPNVSQTSLSATFPSGGILFEGAGGKAGAINNYNEIVGQIDFDSTREIDGKTRRKRGFIYPYNAAGSDITRMARFANKAWYLDDLTNDGSLSGNNQYRVVDATDINDAGVISGTALKCSGGYSTTSHNASCSGTETVVAVKLVPIAGATSSNISQRSTDTTTSERSGGSLGLWSLILLALGWFRRK
ncbi:DUF3466 family protein [Vibrio diazotrophicus]|uniref:DUF3466 family protein n=1 Tax=Vibrio diazotrophicus TaxID=685 RepID=UPI0005A695B9|nr:DUF3466 family protein [Vibrio diazotrophicus]